MLESYKISVQYHMGVTLVGNVRSGIGGMPDFVLRLQSSASEYFVFDVQFPVSFGFLMLCVGVIPVILPDVRLESSAAEGSGE